jgi:hypothetical protein
MMPYPAARAKAWEIAARAPDNHPFCVAAQTLCEGHGDDAFLIALIHDSVEDGYANWVEISAEFPPAVYDCVFALTRQPDEPYMKYINRVIAEGGEALVVKRVDVRVNLHRCMKDGDAHRARRYAKALDLLDRAVAIGGKA